MRTKEAVVSCMFMQTHLSHLLIYAIFDIGILILLPKLLDRLILFDKFKLDSSFVNSLNYYPFEIPKIEIIIRKTTNICSKKHNLEISLASPSCSQKWIWDRNHDTVPWIRCYAMHDHGPNTFYLQSTDTPQSRAGIGWWGVFFCGLFQRESVWTVENHLYITGKQWKFPVMTQFNEGKTKYKWLLVPIEKDKLSASASGNGPLVHFFLCAYAHSKICRGTPKSPNKKTPT